MEKSKVLIKFLLNFRQSGDVLFFLNVRRLRGCTATEDLQKVPERLISEHKSFQTQMQLYDVHISELVNFLLALAELYDVIDTTYFEVEKAK